MVEIIGFFLLLILVFLYTVITMARQYNKKYNGGFSGIKSNFNIPLDLCINQNTEPKLCVKYEDINGRLKYVDHKPPYSTTTHNGQIKLLMTEIQFLTQFISDKKTIILYTGSAANNKLSILTSLFKNTYFVLFDPNEHFIQYKDGNQYTGNNIDETMYFISSSVNNHSYGAETRRSYIADEECYINMYGSGRIKRGNKKIGKIPDNIVDIICEFKYRHYIVEDLFTTEIAKLFANIREDVDLLYISDIRTAEDGEPTTFDILWNSAQMYNWLKILKPRYFMLKFRCPFMFGDRKLQKEYETKRYARDDLTECEIDFIDNYKKGVYKFIKPIFINLQCFAPTFSAETRIIGNSLECVEYDILEYEEKMFYYNNVVRPYRWCEHNHINKKLGVDGCHDCALMGHIIDEYRKKFGGEGDIIYDITEILHRDFYKNAHGYYLQKISDPNMYNKYKSQMRQLTTSKVSMLNEITDEVAVSVYINKKVDNIVSKSLTGHIDIVFGYKLIDNGDIIIEYDKTKYETKKYVPSVKHNLMSIADKIWRTNDIFSNGKTLLVVYSAVDKLIHNDDIETRTIIDGDIFGLSSEYDTVIIYLTHIDFVLRVYVLSILYKKYKKSNIVDITHVDVAGLYTRKLKCEDIRTGNIEEVMFDVFMS
jgi:hypothetical protein